MSSAKDPDSRAEAALVENESDIARYFQRRLPSFEDASDAYGDFLLTVWKSRRKVPADADSARLWLYGVARNVLLNSRRSAARRRSAGAEIELSAQVDSSAVDADVVLDVRAAIASLDRDDAELVRLIYWDGLRSHEAARVLGINPSTARSRLSEAKRRLIIALGPRYDERPAAGPGQVPRSARS